MKKILHPVAGTVALLTIATFWLSTVGVELAGTEQAIVWVKTAIPWGLLVLIPALAVTGGTGFALSKRISGPLVSAKKGRMPVIAANGLLVLVPAALFLAWKASAGEFDAAFYAVQAIELVAGAINLVLLGLNFRDGLKMTGKLRRSQRPRNLQQA